ncbi:uncharacterized protein EURHEDRAFT_352962 [Aspergillus ruber CBS 135680]|uniref:Uncharacterized protein n=1 Tax=Aspergillus ruber (strain CBS 135680) TaxID=1388766 RepID=A0A017SIH2_ASPRC|nr:uncharacterized protein EURHEDRAFT_352962 [Aspergillus ruber CBS 135680]EYE96464.1 hypothetical protein EURHEDRAFT_352962 [Aspergillus ruber CBS 135680]
MGEVKKKIKQITGPQVNIRNRENEKSRTEKRQKGERRKAKTNNAPLDSFLGPCPKPIDRSNTTPNTAYI